MSDAAPTTLDDRIADDIWAARESKDDLTAIASTLTANLAIIIVLTSRGEPAIIARSVARVAETLLAAASRAADDAGQLVADGKLPEAAA